MKINEILISIVVPVYNVEEYIEDCVNSIKEQSHSKFELILVDDGSTDNSGMICDNFAKNDSRIITVHKKNGGNNSARKAGISIAKGKYIMFVDSDDWIEKDMCEIMIKTAEETNSDIVRCGLKVEGGSGEKRIDAIPCGVYKTEEEKQYLYSHLIIFDSKTKQAGTNNSFCTQIMTTKLLNCFYQAISDETQYGEDFACVVSGILNANSICFTDRIFYHYRMRESSITHTSNFLYYTQVNSLYLCLKHIFEKNKNKDILLPQLEEYIDILILRGINSRFIIPRKTRIPSYMFPPEKIPYKAKIALYGAGTVGKSIYLQLTANHINEIAIWVDKNYSQYKKEGYNVQPPEDLLNTNFDYVIIAVIKKDTLQSIKNDLYKKYNISEEKIIQELPMNVFTFYNNP